jgi:muconolactone delta-isomerase
VPAEVDGQSAGEMISREATRARELAGAGHLVRLWTLPGRDRSLGLWQTDRAPGLEEILASLPLARAGWLEADALPLTPHPSDPAIVREQGTTGSPTG